MLFNTRFVLEVDFRLDIAFSLFRCFSHETRSLLLFSCIDFHLSTLNSVCVCVLVELSQVILLSRTLQLDSIKKQLFFLMWIRMKEVRHEMQPGKANIKRFARNV